MVEDNSILVLLRTVLVPISKVQLARKAEKVGKAPFAEEHAPDGTVYSVELGTGAGFKHYKSYEEIEADFLQGEITSEALKMAVTKGIDQLLEHTRSSFAQDPRSKVILNSANLKSGEVYVKLIFEFTEITGDVG